MTKDAPDLTSRRRPPKPPEDFGVDSAEVSAVVRQPKLTTSKERSHEEEPAVQFNTRLSWSIKKRLDALKVEKGVTMRELVEHAIENTYPR